MARLVLSLDGQSLAEYNMSKERYTIGRLPDNDIRIDNAAVSGHHALIINILNDSFLEDLNSTNGTYVNGRKITVVTEDDGYVPSRSFQSLKKLIEVDQIFALNGTSGTANVLAMMPLITDNKLPTVVTTAPNDLVYTPVRPTVFTIGANYQDAFFAQLKYIHEKMAPANAVYGLIRQDDDFGATIEAGYDRAVKQFKLKDAIRLKFKRGQSNFSAEIAQLRDAGVNVLANGGIIAGALQMKGWKFLVAAALGIFLGVGVLE